MHLNTAAIGVLALGGLQATVRSHLWRQVCAGWPGEVDVLAADVSGFELIRFLESKKRLIVLTPGRSSGQVPAPPAQTDVGEILYWSHVGVAAAEVEVVSLDQDSLPAALERIQDCLERWRSNAPGHG